MSLVDFLIVIAVICGICFVIGVFLTLKSPLAEEHQNEKGFKFFEKE